MALSPFKFVNWITGQPVALEDAINAVTNPLIPPTDVYFKSGRPWADVRAFGAVGDDSTDDYPAFIAAINVLNSLGGGILYVPPGIYYISQGIILNINITLAGSGRTSSYIVGHSNDIIMVTLGPGGQNYLQDLAIFGKGFYKDTDGIFGATQNCVQMNSSGGGIKNVSISGGYYGLELTSIDAIIYNANIESCYGPSLVHSLAPAANWIIRCKWDQGFNGTVGDLRPFSAWAPATAYIIGDVVIVNNYAIVCTVAGTSGAIAPDLKNYGTNIPDGAGALVWRLMVPNVFSSINFTGGTAADVLETHLFQCDHSGEFDNSMVVNQPGAYVISTDAVFSSPISILDGKTVYVNGCELGSDFNINTAYAGRTILTNNVGITTTIDIDVNIGANVNDFIVTNNYFGGGTITVAPGTSDFYVINNNPRSNVVDGGTGLNKTVTPSQAIGYLPGSGGTVAQVTVKTSTVTINRPSGLITTASATVTAAVIVSFAVNNTLVSVGDVIAINHQSGGTVGAYTINAAAGASQATIYIRNNTAGNLAEILNLNFALIKAARA